MAWLLTTKNLMALSCRELDFTLSEDNHKSIWSRCQRDQSIENIFTHTTARSPGILGNDRLDQPMPPVRTVSV
jgi:hypothetical protein